MDESKCQLYHIFKYFRCLPVVVVVVVVVVGAVNERGDGGAAHSAWEAFPFILHNLSCEIQIMHTCTLIPLFVCVCVCSRN